MAVNPAVRVGIIIFVALVALAAVAWFLTDYRIRVSGYTITTTFDNALGLTKGSQVTMAGVTIGQVDDISLDRKQRAVVRMLINRRYRIPEGSRFILRVGLLIGEKYVDIIPNRQADAYIPAGSTIDGEVPPRIEDILPAANELVANLNAVSKSLKDVLSDDEFETRIKRSLANIESATASLDRTMAGLEGIVTAEQDDIRIIVSNVARASESLRDLTGEIEQFARRGDVQSSITGTLSAAQKAAENLERTTASLEQLTTSPEFQEDIRQTVSGAREAVEQAQEVLTRVKRILGGGSGGPLITPRETSLETLFRPDDGRFRATVSATLPLSEHRFLNLGVYDIGADNKLILQPGQAIGPRTDFRYGIYASRLGFGLDHQFSARSYGTLNLHDPKDPRLDLQAGYNVTDRWGLLMGVDDLFGQNMFTLGARFTR